MWESTAVAALALGGIAIAAVPLGGLARARAGWRSPQRALAAVASLGAALLMLPMLASTGLVRDSQASFRAGDLTRAADRAQKAVDAAPWSASAYAQRALVDEADGRLVGARDDLGEAMRREPDNWRFPLLLARVQAERGKSLEAVGAYRRARALRPNALTFTPVAQPVGGR
jgi:tetratricopeptide (TPR) repeat protein